MVTPKNDQKKWLPQKNDLKKKTWLPKNNDKKMVTPKKLAYLITRVFLIAFRKKWRTLL